jgi:hypothetical protein
MSAILTPKVADPAEGVIKALKEEVRWAHASLMANAKPNEYDAIQSLVLSYNPRINLNTYACPACWMRRHVRAPLSPSNGTNDYDLLNCGTCGNDVIIPF